MHKEPTLVSDQPKDFFYCSNNFVLIITFFEVSIVITQVAGLLICKTRSLSLTSQGMKNRFLLFGIFTEILLVVVLCYFKPLQALGTRNLRLVHFFPSIPFACLILCFDETRKALMRQTSKERVDTSNNETVRVKGWLERNFAW